MHQDNKAEMVLSSFILHENGLEPIENPTFEQWLDCGQFLKKANKSLYFWIGDWLNYGHKRWGEKYLEAIDRTGYDIQTLRNYKWVASRIPTDLRMEGLAFRHYQAVADSDIEHAEQKQLLEEARAKKMNADDFRKYVSQRNLPSSPPQPQPKSQPPPIAETTEATAPNSLSYGRTNTEEARQKILAAKELLLNRIEQFNGSPEDIAWLYSELIDIVNILTRIVDENGKSANT